MPAPRIRLSSAEDVDALVDIRVVVATEGRWIGLEAPVDRGEQRELMAAVVQTDRLVVAEMGGAVVGYAGVHDVGAGLWELFMAILPGHRGQGIGHALLADLIAWAQTRPDAAKLVLQVWPHNDAAITLYRRLGFVVEGYRHRHWPRRDGSRWDVIEMGLLVEP